MADEKFVLISMEDAQAKSLADVLGSKTCKKIIDYLASHDEASQKDLADALNIPINTIDYNIKKLVKSGFVQKRKNFFWSKKGRKIVMYELTHKSVIISPRRSTFDKMKSIFPAILLTFIGSFAIYVYEKVQGVATSYSSVQSIVVEKAIQGGDVLIADAPAFASKGGEMVGSSIPDAWLWFLIGGILVLGIVSFLNWRKL